MKVFSAFTHVFVIFSYLTLGSLLIIVSFHLLSVEDALLKVRELYANPWSSMQTGLVGLLFIMVGLAFARTLLKKGREQEALIFQSEMGPVVVSALALEDVVKKVIKKFHLVKEAKIKTLIRGRDVEIRVRMTLWSGSRITELLSEIQEEIGARVRKLLGQENKLEVLCDVQRIEDHEEEHHEVSPPTQVASY